MSDELNDIMNATHVYRRQLAEIERRNGKADQATVDNPFKTTGEERQKLEAIDADLSAAELRAQLKATEARLAKLEATPVLESRAPRASGVGTESEAYAARWLKAMVSGDRAELRAMATSTTNAPIPVDMERRIINKMYQASVIRQLATVQTIDSDRQITVEASQPAAALVAEAGSISAADFTFDRVTVNPYKFVVASKMSQEYIDDSIGNAGIGSILNWVADRFGVAMARETEEYYTIGSGASQPQGIGDTTSTAWATTNTGRIINQGIALTEDQTVSNISADNVIDVVHAVPVAYRTGRFAILTSDAAVKAIRKLKANNEYIWLPGGAGNNQGITVGAPGTIYGVPYYVNEWMPSTAAQTSTGADVRGSALVIAGNWEYFGIFDRTGIQSMIDPYSAASTLETTMYMWMRTDSKILLPDAFAAIYAPNAS
jgi:HK97 family phage major capsid protein